MLGSILVKDIGICYSISQAVHSVKLFSPALSIIQAIHTFNIHLGLPFSSKCFAEKPWTEAQKSGPLCPLVELLF